MSRRAPVIRYRCPDGPPPPGAIVMSNPVRARRAYRVLSAHRCRGAAALGMARWLLSVEPMPAAAGLQEIEAGAPMWGLKWDRRG